MTATARRSALGRPALLVQASKGVLGFAVLGLAAACSSNDGETDVASGPGHSGSGAGLDWWRVDLAYVSAYVLVRGREAALVDCGLGSRVDDIGAVLGAAGGPFRPVTDGQEVFGLHGVDTPGHTPATSRSSTSTRGCSSPGTLSSTPSTG